MQLKEISVRKVISGKDGRFEQMDITLTASLAGKEEVNLALMELNGLIEAKAKVIMPCFQVKQQEKTLCRANDTQWFRLRQLLLKKKGMKEDHEILEYVTNQLGTVNLEWISSEEMEMLIMSIEAQS